MSNLRDAVRILGTAGSIIVLLAFIVRNAGSLDLLVMGGTLITVLFATWLLATHMDVLNRAWDVAKKGGAHRG